MDQYSSHRVVREVVNLGSDYATKIFRGFVNSFLNAGHFTLDKWRLVRVEMLKNDYFEEEFLERSEEFARQGYAKDEVSPSYGFLAAANEELVDLALREGLKVRFCPINSLGYCIAGVHLCIHGDVCLQEATLETGDSDQMILVVFKFMFGRTRRVAPVTTKDMAIIAPSPGFNCHIADARPSPADSMADQYLRSLAYLYEFENSFYHPVSRPRQCCPLAAMHLRRKAGGPRPPKPPQFLPTAAGRFPATASSTSAAANEEPSAHSVLSLPPSVVDAVGSVLSELRQQVAAQQQQQQRLATAQQQPAPPRLDGIRSFLKNASTSNTAGSSSTPAGSSYASSSRMPAASVATVATATTQPLMQLRLQQPLPPLLESSSPDQPRRNAFLTDAAAAAAHAAGTHRFHPYTRAAQPTDSTVAAAAAAAAPGNSTAAAATGLGKFLRNSRMDRK